MPPSPERLKSVLVDGEMTELAKLKAMYHDLKKKKTFDLVNQIMCVNIHILLKGKQ
jgi:hypothetical protein